MMDEITAILAKITNALEEHSRILVTHQKQLGQLSAEVASIKEKVENSGAANSIESSDEKFIADMSARLKAISESLDKKNRD